MKFETNKHMIQWIKTEMLQLKTIFKTFLKTIFKTFLLFYCIRRNSSRK